MSAVIQNSEWMIPCKASDVIVPRGILCQYFSQPTPYYFWIIPVIGVTVLFTYLYCGLKNKWTSYSRESTKGNEMKFAVDLYIPRDCSWVLRISWVMPYLSRKVRWYLLLLSVPCRGCYSRKRGVESGKKMKSVNTVSM